METTEARMAFDIATWTLHGDDDQIISGAKSAVPGAPLHIFAGAPRGICSIVKNRVNEDLRAFVQKGKQVPK